MNYRGTRTILEKFSEEHLQRLAKQHAIELDAKDIQKKSNTVDAIYKHVESVGLKHTSTLFTIDELETLCEANLDGKPLKAQLSKPLAEHMIREGTAAFLERKYNEEQIKIFLDAFEQKPVGTSKKELVEQVSSLVHRTGMEIVLSHLEVSFLKLLMKDAELSCTTSSRDRIVEALCEGKEAKAEEKKEEPKTFSKEKLPLKKGITYQDIFQHYFKNELSEFCSKNGLRVSGKKDELIKRIIDFLENEKEAPKKSGIKEGKQDESESDVSEVEEKNISKAEGTKAEAPKRKGRTAKAK